MKILFLFLVFGATYSLIASAPTKKIAWGEEHPIASAPEKEIALENRLVELTKVCGEIKKMTKYRAVYPLTQEDLNHANLLEQKGAEALRLADEISSVEILQGENRPADLIALLKAIDSFREARAKLLPAIEKAQSVVAKDKQ